MLETIHALESAIANALPGASLTAVAITTGLVGLAAGTTVTGLALNALHTYRVAACDRQSRRLVTALHEAYSKIDYLVGEVRELGADCLEEPDERGK